MNTNYKVSVCVYNVIHYFLLFQVIVNGVMTGLGSYTKVAIAVTLHADSVAPDLALILNGICTQLGALLGAVVFFILVYFTDLFKSF